LRSGGTLCVDARVGETRRPHVWDVNHRELAQQYVAGRQHRDWEPHDAVIRRFDAGVQEGLDASQGTPLVVVIEDPPRFWSELAFPNAWLVTVRRSRGALLADAPIRVQ